MMISIEKLISAVKKHPVLYDSSDAKYSSKQAKLKAWNAVARATIQGWDLMSSQQKELEDKILRTKWRNLRDCFVKEFKWQSEFFKHQRRTRRKYIYYDLLTFLAPSIQTKVPDNGILQVQCKTERNDLLSEETNDESSMPSVASADENEFPDVKLDTVADDKSKKQYSVDPLYDEPISDDSNSQMPPVPTTHLQAEKFKETDYDRMFLLSLLPSFRQIPNDIKLQVRIQFQHILFSALNPSTIVADK
ncbi:uncharacterized protein [Chelonus insularis]|uniref:uncharacterized protein n=1 Tax=Chelonus insularis TaxID=460826 RepID=UPI00158ABE5C|nr:uncharacterized protein LOC118074210 [Chelonus insularis]